MYKSSLHPFFKLFVFSILSVSHATLPPIIDLYQTSSTVSNAEVERLKHEVHFLTQQLEKAHAQIQEQLELIEHSQQNATVSQQSFIQRFFMKKPKATPVSSLPKQNVLAEKQWEHALALTQSKRYTDAINAFQVFIKQYPTHQRHASAHYFLGQLALLNGDPAQALHYLTRFIKQYPEDTRISDVQFYIGLAYYAQQNNAMAHKTLTQFIQQHPNHSLTAKAREHLTQLEKHI